MGKQEKVRYKKRRCDVSISKQAEGESQVIGTIAAYL